MDVACQNCSAVYPISEQKLAGRVVRFRCKQCGTSILVDGRSLTSVPPPPPPSDTSAPGARDTTRRPSSLPPGAPPLPPEVFAPGYGSIPPPAPAAEAHEVRPPLPTFDSSAVAVPLTRTTSPGHSAPDAAPQLTASQPGHSRPTASRPAAVPGWEVDVDPSVYEDETVAMTATELEAASGAEFNAAAGLPPAPPRSRSLTPLGSGQTAGPPSAPLQRSNPPPKPWMAGPPSSGRSVPSAPPSSSSALPPPPAPPGTPPFPSNGPFFTSKPAQPPTSHGLPNSGLPNTGPPLGLPHGLPAPPPPAPFAPGSYGQQSAPGPVPTPGGFGAPASPFGAPGGRLEGSSGAVPSGAVPTNRAESWALGAQVSPAPGGAADRRSPSPSGRTWTSVDPHPGQRRENRWMFPLLLVVLGAGGLILGGLLGKTWIAGMINPAPSAAPASDPNLPAFAPLDANTRLEKAQAEAVHCLNADTTPLTGLIVARFATNGTLEFLQMNGTLSSAPEAPCVRSVFEKVSVAPFSGPPAQVEKAVELRPQP